MWDPDERGGEHELKWVLPARRSECVRGFLASRLRPDPLFPRGWVVSIYYDTPDWRFLDEKRNSDFLKTKVRVRWYEDRDREPVGDEAFLEVKAKVGGLRRKRRLQAPLAARTLRQMRLSDARLRHLPELFRSEGIELPGPMRPAFSVRYRRLRAIDPASGARVAFDDRIHVPAVHRAQMPHSRRTRLGQSVVEVKGQGDALPVALRPLLEQGCRRRAFSKYEACYDMLLGGLA